jgi:hypothetical protein
MSYKEQRLAVLICGDLRTWTQAYENIFKYAEMWGEAVDYYFATWNSTQDIWIPIEGKTVHIDSKRTVTEQEIVDKFHGRNLIDCKIMDLNNFSNRMVTFYYQAYLAKIASISKRRHELDNKFVYGQVIEIRPDLGFVFEQKQQQEECMRHCEDFEYKISHTFYGNNIKLPHLTDFYYRSNSLTSDVLGNRYWFGRAGMEYNQGQYTINTNNHWLLLSYVYTRRLLDNQLMNDPGSQYTLEEHGIWPLRPPSVDGRSDPQFT